MGDRQSVEALEWWTKISRTRNKFPHAGSGREVHLPAVPNVKDEWYCAEAMEVFEYLGCFGLGVNVCPVDISLTETLKDLCRVGMRRRRRGCIKYG